MLHFHIGSTDSDINGQAQLLDTAPIISNGMAFLPIKFVAGPLGATVKWDQAQQMVTVTLGSTTIQLWIGKGTVEFKTKSRRPLFIATIRTPFVQRS